MKSIKFWSAALTILALSGLLLAGTAIKASGQEGTPPPVVQVGEVVTPKLSPAMRDVKYVPPTRKLDREEINPMKNPGLFLPDLGLSGTDTKNQDPLVASGLNALNAPSPLLNFEGQGDFNLYSPPDTTGDVGPNHFVQMVNVETAVYDKSGNLLDNWANNQLWAGFGGPCENDNSGDPVVLYDDLADRWVLTQFAVESGNGQCFAVSTTPDPLGTYYLYYFVTPDFPDYPKIGVWPDGYYMGTNSGYPNQYYAHVFNRQAMLAGDPAGYQYVGGQANFLMPADADGLTPPPAGDPGIFYTFYDEGYPNHPAGTFDRLAIYEFDVDWTTPGNSTFALAQELETAEFNYTTCGFFNRSCLDQLGTGNTLDAVDPWPMVRLQYRNMTSYQAMVGNFTTDVDGTDHAGIRWFELRKQGADWSIFQEGTWAPDAHSRFMGSIAMDGSGNLALGYSITSATMYPSIRYTVHATSDAPGTMQAEAELMAGGGSQTSSQRWGDYSATVVDPTDNCTFWITNMYHDVTDAGYSWNTRIGTFRVPGCTGSAGYVGTLAGTVTDDVTTNPIANANVQVTLSVTQTYALTTDANGEYSSLLSPGIYTVTASAFGYQPETVADVEVFSGTVTTQNFALTPAVSYLVEGYVTDANTGWPLYASIDIGGYPGDPIWTDPVTGHYSISLPEGIDYTFNVSAFVNGYVDASRTVGPLTANATEDFPLDANLAACNAPGYVLDYDWLEDFEGSDGGFTVSGTTTWEWGAPTSGPGEAFSGQNVWATNLAGDYDDSENGYITSPNIDLSAYAGASMLLNWRQWAVTEGSYDYISVEVSNNGGSTWSSPVYGPLSGSIAPNWDLGEVLLDSTYAVNNFRIRFHFTSDGSVTYEGWYVDDIGISAQYPPAPTVVLSEDFESDDGGFTHSGTLDTWEYGVPTTTFPGGCADTSHGCWDTNLDGNYDNSSNMVLLSPVIDLSGVTLPPGVNLYLRWDQAIHIESASWDHADAAVSINGGAFTNVWSHTGATRTNPWGTVGPYDITAAAGTSVQLRYTLSGDSTVNFEGWSVDNIEVYYATPFEPQVDCAIPAGGLIVGNVYDDNTSAPLVGALVVDEDGSATYSVETPADPAVNDGFYVLYSESSQNVTASISGGYASDTEAVTVLPGDTTAQDFYLGAGWLEVTPAGLHVTLDMGDSSTTSFDLANLGAVDSGFDIKELDEGFVPVRNLVSIPAFKGTVPESNVPTSMFRDPNAPKPSSATPTMAFPLAGEPAFAMDVYPGENLVNIPDTTAPGTWNIVGNIAGSQYFAGDFVGGDFSTLYVLDYGTNTLYGVDTTTAVPTAIGPAAPSSGTWSGATGGPGGTLYASSAVCGTASYLHTVDVETGAVSLVGTITNGACIIDIAMNAAGELYGVDIVADTLVQIDPATGAGTVIGSVGINANYAQGLDFEEDTGVLYWAAYSSSGELRVIDTTTGASTLVGAFPGGAEVDCLAFATGGGGGGVPWLAESPITGTVASLDSQVIDVSFDAGVAEVNQPGDYLATLRINNDTPYGALLVPVTMTVNVPPSFVKLEGTVTGLGYCDADPAVLEDAQVVIVGATDTYTLTTDAAGYYSTWLDETEEPLAIYVTYPEHTDGVATDVALVVGEVTTVNFDLRWLEPCVITTPTSLEVTLASGSTQTLELNLDNLGAALSTFELSEVPPVAALKAPKHSVVIGDLTFTANSKPASAATPFKLAPLAPDEIIITHSASQTITPLNSVSCNAGGLHTDNSYIRKFDLAAFGIGGAFEITSVQVGIETAAGATGSQPVSVYLYTWDPTDPFTWAYFDQIGYVDTTVDDQTETVLDIPVTGIAPAGSYLVVEFFTPSGQAAGNSLFVGSNDLGQTDYTYLAAADCGVTDPTPTDDIGFPEMQLVMNVVGEAGSADVPWLSEAPITGTVDADSAQIIDVTFDTMTYTVGTYTASLKVKTSDPMNPTVVVPVTMNIEAPAYSVELTPVTHTLSAMPGETVTYTLTVHNTGNTVNTFNLTHGGNLWDMDMSATSTTLAPDVSVDILVAVHIPADASGDTDVATISVTGDGGAADSSVLTTHAVEEIFGVEITPVTDTETALPGETVTYTLHIHNSGNTPNTFTVAASGNTWTVELPEDSFSLNPGEGADFLVVVHIPENAGGDTDVVTITATGAGGATGTSTLTTHATQTTFEIYLPIIWKLFP